MRFTLAWIVLLFAMIALYPIEAATPPAHIRALDNFLRVFLRTDRAASPLTYASAEVDLNNDSEQEVIVYVRGQECCGSGGCLALILQRKSQAYVVLGRITIANLPIRVLDSRVHGWHSIGVWVQGGGIQPGYEAELRFNGKGYPSNPSVYPARRADAKAPGVTAISDSTQFDQLH